MVLETMARHANGKASFAVWKEQVRALAIYSEKKLYVMVNYIHANPVPRDWSRCRRNGHSPVGVFMNAARM